MKLLAFDTSTELISIAVTRLVNGQARVWQHTGTGGAQASSALIPAIEVLMAEADLRAFENLLLGWPLVREAHMLSGESDFMLKCIARDVTGFQNFVLDELTAAPNVASVKTFLTIRRAKREPGIPIGISEA